MLPAHTATSNINETNVYPYYNKKEDCVFLWQYSVRKLTRAARTHRDLKETVDEEQFAHEARSITSNLPWVAQKLNERELSVNVRGFNPSVLTSSPEQDTQAYRSFWDGSATITKPQSLQEKISNAKTEDDIVRITSQASKDYVETYISYLHKLMAEDGDDYSVHLESLKNFVMFLLDHSSILHSQIGVTPNSFVDVIWDAPDYTTTLVMEFLPVNQISYTVVKRSHDMTQKPQYVSGRVSSETIMEHIKPICPQLVI